MKAIKAKNMKTIRFYSVFIALIIFIPFTAFNQEKEEDKKELDKEVRVIKPYEPAISDAFKINELPKIQDTLKIEPRFDYFINPDKLETGFSLTPIKAAKMVGEPLNKLYPAYLRIGFSSYIAPFAEFSITNKRSKKHAVGAFLRHYSKHGKVKIEEGDRVYAGQSDNVAKIYGKKFVGNSSLGADLNFTSKTVYYYGYNFSKELPFQTLEFLPDEKDGIPKQNYLFFDPTFHFKTEHTDSSHVNYDLTFNYAMIEDNYKNTEHATDLNGTID